MENVCLYYEECKNKDNILKCGKCENNPDNTKFLENYELSGTVHDRKNKAFYIYRDNFEEY